MASDYPLSYAHPLCQDCEGKASVCKFIALCECSQWNVTKYMCLYLETTRGPIEKPLTNKDLHSNLCQRITTTFKFILSLLVDKILELCRDADLATPGVATILETVTWES